MAPYLDPINQAFVDGLVGGPPLDSLSYTAAREFLEGAQKHEPSTDVTKEEFDVPVGPSGSVKAFVYKPATSKGDLPVIFYFHGGGWILGSPNTHDSLVRDLVRETGAAIVFPYYTPAPEAKFPTQFEEVYGVVEYFVKKGGEYGLVTDKIAFAGDSVGGHMAIGMSTLSAQRKLRAKVVFQALFYPVTNTHAESATYTTFASGPYLTASILRWMYSAFFKDSPSSPDPSRATILGSPLLFTPEEASFQPSTLIVVAGVDPLQEEGKEFAHLLQRAGVECALLEAEGQVHDFVMLEATRSSATARAVVELAGVKFKGALGL